MIAYIRGVVTEVTSSYIIIENNNIGYFIYVANPYYYKVDNEYIVYTYSHIRQEEYTLYGFKSKEEYDMFIKLISVKGLGPKTILPMLAVDSTTKLQEAIEEGNLSYLKRFPKIGDKVARQIILDLKGKIVVREESKDDIRKVLLSLGYKNIDINKIISKVDSSLSLEEQVKQALRLMV